MSDQSPVLAATDRFDPKADSESPLSSIAPRAWFRANLDEGDEFEVPPIREPLARVLDSVCEFIDRYVVFPSSAATHAVALFVATTWVADAFEVAPYLLVTGPEKRTGKSRLLEVIALLVRSPILAASITEAALFRVIDSRSPTVLIDEADAIFGKRAESVEGLRAVINAGHRRGAKVYRMAGSRGDKLQEFNAFAPKVLAGIGDFAPDTVVDRSITVRLQRKAADASVMRFRRRFVEEEAVSLRLGLETSLDGLEVGLGEAWPHLPEELDDRAQDTWEPLFAVADMAGDPWPQYARFAAVELSSGRLGEESLGVQLLSDINAVWPSRHDKLFTADLLTRLHALDESPWGDWDITGHRLARMLRPFGVTSRKIRIGDDTRQGWRYADLEPLFSLYVPDQSGTTGTPVTAQGSEPVSKWNVQGDGDSPKPVERKDSSDVPLPNREHHEVGGTAP